jgi:ADP-ribose pyrophosphatase YjhB (NUDIX family)
MFLVRRKRAPGGAVWAGPTGQGNSRQEEKTV